MIRNLIIIDKKGTNLLEVNFGECHSLAADPLMISSFISAIYAFGQSLNSRGIKNIRFEHLYFMLYTQNEFIFLISVDDDLESENRAKLERISSLFLERYSEQLRELEEASTTPDFTEFIDLLLDLDIAQKNCGEHPDCEDCPNHRVLPLDEISKAFLEK